MKPAELVGRVVAVVAMVERRVAVLAGVLVAAVMVVVVRAVAEKEEVREEGLMGVEEKMEEEGLAVGWVMAEVVLMASSLGEEVTARVGVVAQAVLVEGAACWVVRLVAPVAVAGTVEEMGAVASDTGQPCPVRLRRRVECDPAANPSSPLLLPRWGPQGLQLRWQGEHFVAAQIMGLTLPWGLG